MKPVVASVPYLNAKPLVRQLDLFKPVDLVFDVPSKLPAMVDHGEADVAMASSFDALRTPGRKVVDGASISTLQAVESVRLFSKVPFDRIRTLALDQSSLTSNHLIQILLSEGFGVKPTAEIASPDINEMLGRFDACVLIGDKGLCSEYADAHILDMGTAWRQLTGLPFVWALWIGGEGLTTELAQVLRDAKAWGLQNMDEVVPWASEQTGIPLNICDRYLRQTMSFDLTPQHLEGLSLYGSFLKKHALLDEVYGFELV